MRVVRPWAVTAAVLLGAGCAPEPMIEEAVRTALGDLVAEVDQAELMSVTTDLVNGHSSDEPFPCEPGDPEKYPRFCALTRTGGEALITAKLEGLGFRVTRQEMVAHGLPTTNLIADLPGTSRPDEVVLVGAHFDAFYAGADDNSSGVAALLELARVLSRHRFERTIRFVGFDLEELGLIGSARYVQATRGERLSAVVIFDCIGYYDARPGSQLSLPGLPTPAAGNFLAVIGNDLSSGQASELFRLNQALALMEVVPLISPRDGVFTLGGDLMRSDHAPFWLSQEKALFLTDTANFRNPNYHSPKDTLETLNPDLFHKAVQVAAAGIAYWAGGPK
ncbi:MAG TPA: M28 family peptidase [Myxococcaceae bacterium]|nr:M28 family peptidase [Myxococcaceae bacterium]